MPIPTARVLKQTLSLPEEHAPECAPGLTAFCSKLMFLAATEGLPVSQFPIILFAIY